MNVKELEELVLSLQKKLDRATAEISKLKAENTMLKEKLAKYESKRRNNSKNTSQPPSKDQKSETAKTESVENTGIPVSQYNGRQPSDRPVGGQKGHKGKTLSKEEVEALIETNTVLHGIVYHGHTQNHEDCVVRYELALGFATKVIERRFASIYLVPERYIVNVLFTITAMWFTMHLSKGLHLCFTQAIMWLWIGFLQSCRILLRGSLPLSREPYLILPVPDDFSNHAPHGSRYSGKP